MRIKRLNALVYRPGVLLGNNYLARYGGLVSWAVQCVRPRRPNGDIRFSFFLHGSTATRRLGLVVHRSDRPYR